MKKKSISPPGCLGRMPAKNCARPVLTAEPGGGGAGGLPRFDVTSPCSSQHPLCSTSTAPRTASSARNPPRSLWKVMPEGLSLLPFRNKCHQTCSLTCSGIRVCQRSVSFSKDRDMRSSSFLCKEKGKRFLLHCFSEEVAAVGKLHVAKNLLVINHIFTVLSPLHCCCRKQF